MLYLSHLSRLLYFPACNGSLNDYLFYWVPIRLQSIGLWFVVSITLIVVSSFGVNTWSFSIPTGYIFSCFSWSPSPFLFRPERGLMFIDWYELRSNSRAQKPNPNVYAYLVRPSLIYERQGFSHARKMMMMIPIIFKMEHIYWRCCALHTSYFLKN